MGEYIAVAVIVITALIGQEVIKWAIKTFFQKTIDTEYRTVTACVQCKTAEGADLNKFKKEVRDSFGMIKGLLMVIASKKELTLDELKELVK